jgi:Putative effector of murein hydrolase
MLDYLFSSPLFGFVLCIITYSIGNYLYLKYKYPVFNPCIIATALCIIFLQTSKMSVAQFNQAGDIISLFIPIATSLLALSIYRQRLILKKYFIPIVIGCSAGAITSIVSSYLLCQLLKLDQVVLAAVLPKSVTTAIAIEITQQLNGIVALTILCVFITGVLGAVFSPILIKVFKIDNAIAQGVAIGTSSHVLGATKAVELGEIQGAMSGVAIGITGIVTLVLVAFL